jgi:DNA-binding CsgD family transcriptional regulator
VAAILRGGRGTGTSQIRGDVPKGHPRYLGRRGRRAVRTLRGVDSKRAERVLHEVKQLAQRGLDWASLASEVSDVVAKAVPFDRCCWHTVDPGTVLFTGSVHRAIECSGSWLAEYEYVIEDVNKWAFLARSGRLAGATSIATHGDVSRSARLRSHVAYGIGDELRASFVEDGLYWGAVAFLRDADQPTFGVAEVRLLASLSAALAGGFRRALARRALEPDVVAAVDGPGIVVFDGRGQPEMISPAAEFWIAQLVEEPPPTVPAESKLVQAVAAQARALGTGHDPVHHAARSRVRTGAGTWLVVYGTQLSGGDGRSTAVVIQPAAPHEIAPLIALAYGLTERECQVVRLCMEGRPTKQIAGALNVSAYTVQDHLKSVFDKTGVRTRNELVGQIFLEHYAPRWEEVAAPAGGWQALATPELG